MVAEYEMVRRMYIDTHTHLNARQFDSDREAVVHRAVQAGVDIMVIPNVDVDTIEPIQQLCHTYPSHCRAMMGIHPTSIKKDYGKKLAEAERALRKGGYVAIGEIGIDLYWDTTYEREQIEAFGIQIEWALERDLPINIHARNSLSLCIDIVAEYHSRYPQLRGIFHCFDGSIEDAQRIIALGRFKLGIGGLVTFKNATVADVVRRVPLQYIVLETDAPYLSPHPLRGRRNEPARIPMIAAKLATLYEVPLEEIAEKTSANAREVYALDL